MVGLYDLCSSEKMEETVLGQLMDLVRSADRFSNWKELGRLLLTDDEEYVDDIRHHLQLPLNRAVRKSNAKTSDDIRKVFHACITICPNLATQLHAPVTTRLVAQMSCRPRSLGLRIAIRRRCQQTVMRSDRVDRFRKLYQTSYPRISLNCGQRAILRHSGAYSPSCRSYRREHNPIVPDPCLDGRHIQSAL